MGSSVAPRSSGTGTRLPGARCYRWLDTLTRSVMPSLGRSPMVFVAGFLAIGTFAEAADGTSIDSGDTAWMLTSTALVLSMTIPGLALFYGGLVRSRNILSVLMQCLALTCLVTILWVVIGYSLCFDRTGMIAGAITFHSFVGSLQKAFLFGVGADAVSQTIPETVFLSYQLTFAIITPALIAGAYAERMKFSAMLVFSGLWVTLVYTPLCHMAWSGEGSFLGDILGALDFAGGTVVHINAGISALLVALFVGRRRGYPDMPMPPHNLTLTFAGAAMLWVGWFGFNAGSALAANGVAGMAMLVTQVSAAAAALTWMSIEWVKHGKASVLGTVTGAVAGLVAITPASGSAGPLGALVIGAASAAACFWAATSLKQKLGYDDSLDAFGVHGVGGIVGALLTGLAASARLGGQVTDLDMGRQCLAQLASVAFTVGFSGAMTWIILAVVKVSVGLRVSPEAEEEGLDLALHNERGYNL